MNPYRRFASLILAVVPCIAFISCAPAIQQQTASSDEFFAPVGQNGTADSVFGRPFILRRSHETTDQETIKDLKDLITRQNVKLDNVINQIALLAVRQDARMSDLEQLPKSRTTLDSLMIGNNRVTADLLLEMINEQNKRLNEVIIQLKTLAENQRIAASSQYENMASVMQRTVREVRPAMTYEQAIHLYQSNRYKSAKRAFRALLKNGIKEDIADNCCFWIGVCDFQLNRLQQALQGFRNVFQYKESDKMAGSYFMIGQCHERLGERKEAAAAFRKLLALYPNCSLKSITQKKLLALE
jgi:TolA-binding protein